MLLSDLRKAPGFLDVNSDQQNNGLQALLTYDRPTAARLGLTPQNIDSTLYNAFGQSEVSTIYTQLNQYYVVVNHTGLFPSVTVSFNLAPGVSLGQASKAIQQVQQSLNMPTTIHGQYSGTRKPSRPR